MSTLYPVMLNLEGRTCVIVGGGAVATRKVDHLLESGAQITVISPVLHPHLSDLSAAGKITVHQVLYTRGILTDLHPFIVFAATDNVTVNQQVTEEARSLRALVNSVSDQGERDFMNMAAVQRGDITIAFSLGGGSPALLAHLQQKIDNLIGDEYVTLADWMAQERSTLQIKIKSQPERAAVWHQVLESFILDKLRQGDTAAARQLFDQIIQEAIN